jgi:hypothetical protein
MRALRLRAAYRGTIEASRNGSRPSRGGRIMDTRHRRWAMVAAIEPPELEDDAPADSVREAAMLLGVPEWVDPETGQLADDESVRLEDH